MSIRRGQYGCRLVDVACQREIVVTERGFEGVQIPSPDVQANGHATVFSGAGKQLAGDTILNVLGVILIGKVEEGLVASPRQFEDFVLLVLAGFGRVQKFGLEQTAECVFERCLRDNKVRG
jgi:hypothetical protein